LLISKLESVPRHIFGFIGNESDALDKLRFLSVTDPSMLADGSEMEIRIKPDPEAGTITITYVLLIQLACLNINYDDSHCVCSLFWILH
jgi:hypothetical protein